MRVCQWVCAVIGVCAGVANGQYTFTRVADTSATYSGFGAPAMNDAGAVAYQATLTAGGQGIFRAAGGTTTPIASGTFVSPIVSINGLGAVAYAEGSCPSGGGIYLGVEITKKKW